MKVTPKTEKELIEARLLPKGWYPFTIKSAEEATSKKGNEMIAMEVQVYKENGFVFVKDWLMDTEYGAHKLRHCAETCDLIEYYNNGLLDAEQFEGREGYVKIGISKGKDSYPDQNCIDEYAKHPPERKEKEEAKAERAANIGGKKSAIDEEDASDIPF